jgi:hypothetical protein
MGRSLAAHWMLLAGMVAVYLALFFYYYPATHGIEDEVGFINQAIVWSHGAVSAESAGFDQLSDFIECKGRHVCWRNPGRSLLILPLLMFGGLRAIFVSGAVIHLLLTLTTALTFAKLGRSPLWAALVLCHPTLALYSRTIMGDEPAALGLSCALLAFVATNRPGVLAGIAIGVAAVMRYQAGVVLPFFALAILAAPHVNQRGRQALYCLIAGGAFAAALMVYNLVLYGNPTGLVGQGSFSLAYLPKNLAFYVLSLSVIWPLMILAPAFDRSRARYAVLAITVPLLLLTSCWYFQDRHSSWAFTLVLVARLIIPVIPPLVVSYAGCLEEILLDRWLPTRARSLVAPVAVGCCAALLLVLAVLFRSHDAHLRILQSARDELAQAVPAHSLVIGNSTLSKLFAVPSDALPHYRWQDYDYQGTALDQSEAIRAEQRTWYLALLPKSPGSELPDRLRDYVSRYHMTRVSTEHSALILYRADVQANRGTQENETLPVRSASKE